MSKSKSSVRPAARGAMQHDNYVIEVNYNLPHVEQIGGNFDWITDVDGNLILKPPNEHLYPLPKGTVKQRILLMQFDGNAKRPEIIAEMAKNNARPVLSPEFLAFTKKNPDLQRQFPLVGLGSVWVDSFGDRGVLYATYVDSVGRGLALDWIDFGFVRDKRFPAVCTTSPRLRGASK